MTHTPGPWTSDGKIVGWLSGQQPGVAVWAVDEHDPRVSNPVCMVEPHLGGPHQAAGSRHPLEDARLIAAAPDLLDAAKVAFELLAQMDAAEDSQRFWNERVQLAAAITKAEGR